MAEKELRRRIAPSLPITIELQDDSGSKFIRRFNICFDLNVLARIEGRTKLNLLNLDIWSNLNATNLGVMFWSSIIPNHPEYDTRDEKTGERTDDGLEVINSYLDEATAEKVAEVLWDAYLMSLPKAKRESLVKMRAAIENGEKPAENPPTPIETATKSQPGLDSGPSADSISDSLSMSSES